jgi:hypothetical protein
LFEDEPTISLAEVGNWDTVRECPTALDMQAFQQRNCCEKRIVSPRGLERERL